MEISPDQIVLWENGPFRINATMVYTWFVMALILLGSWLVTRRLSSGAKLTRGQHFLEIVVGYMREQIRDVSQQAPDSYLPFVGTLFVFIAVSNLLAIIPGYVAPTGSLSTTAALALCVFIAVPIYGISRIGLVNYLKRYIQPTFIMLPFQVIGEVSRTLALAVRLFGNMMSGKMIIAILLLITPLFFPIVMHALGLLVGMVQAYIFTILAIVYIAAATRAQSKADEKTGNR